MTLFKNLSALELINAVAFFPKLKEQREIQSKLTQNLQKSIDQKTSKINRNGKSELFDLLITQYFDLNNYTKITENIDLVEWITQFTIRKNLIHRLEFPELYLSGNNELIIQEDVFKLLRRPIVDPSDFTFLYSFHSSISTLDVSGLKTLAESYMKNGSFQLIDDNYYLLDQIYNEANNDGLSNISRHSGMEPLELCDLLNEPVENTLSQSGNLKVTAVIDMDIDDDQLIKEFTAYLKQVRNDTGHKPVVNKALKDGQRKTWVSNRVLEYLDIKILDLYVNGKETLKKTPVKLAEIIFPQHHHLTPLQQGNGADKIRKSTIPNVNEIMNEEIIKRILIDNKKVCMSNL